MNWSSPSSPKPAFQIPTHITQILTNYIFGSSEFSSCSQYHNWQFQHQTDSQCLTSDIIHDYSVSCNCHISSFWTFAQMTANPLTWNITRQITICTSVVKRGQKQEKVAYITEDRRRSQQCESLSRAHHDEPSVPTGQHSDQCRAELQSSVLKSFSNNTTCQSHNMIRCVSISTLGIAIISHQ